MDQMDRNKLNDNRIYLLKNLRVDHLLIASLVQDKIISEEQQEKILLSQPTNNGKVRCFIDILVRRGPLAFKCFLKSLILSDQEFIALHLDKTKAEEIKESLNNNQFILETSSRRNNETSQLVPTNTGNVLIPLERQISLPSCSGSIKSRKGFDDIDTNILTIEDEMKGLIQSGPAVFDLKVEYNYDTRKLNKAIYPMISTPRGLVLLFNVRCVRGKEERLGSQFDVKNIRNLFLLLGYELETHEELTSDEIKEVIRNKRNQDGLEQFGSLVIFLMSHGRSRNTMFGSDGKEINVFTDVRNQFDGNNCKKLDGKPKLIFVQACRNEFQTDSGTEHGIHEKADISVAYSTCEEYGSMRFTKLGSPYIRALVLVLSRYAHEKSYSEMMTMVNNLTNEVTHGICKQVSEKLDSFRYEFYFYPIMIPDLIKRVEN